MSYEEIKKFIEDNKIACRSILEETDPIIYKNFCKLTIEEKDRLIPYKGMYSNFNTKEDFRKFIIENNIKTRGDFDDNYSRVYKLFCSSLTEEEKNEILPRKITIKYFLKTYSDFEKFINENNVVSRSYFYRDFPRAYLLFNELLTEDERNSLLPLVTIPSGELSLMGLFEINKFEYVTQKTFDDLKSLKKLRYDFYLPDLNVLIEYQGHQHFDKNNKFYDPNSIVRDKLKFDYAKKNNIPILYFTYEKNLYEKFGYFTEVITDSDILIEKIKEISLTN